eukprot:2101787-Rhodomonas_salina.2
MRRIVGLKPNLTPASSTESPRKEISVMNCAPHAVRPRVSGLMACESDPRCAADVGHGSRNLLVTWSKRSHGSRKKRRG